MLSRISIAIFLLIMWTEWETNTVNALSTKSVKMEDFDKVKLDKRGFERVKSIHYNWYLHSIKALMGQLGKDLMKKLNKVQKKRLLGCLDNIRDKKDVVTAGQCLVEAKDSFELMKVQREQYKQFNMRREPEQLSNVDKAVEESFLQLSSFVQELDKESRNHNNSESFAVQEKDSGRVKSWVDDLELSRESSSNRESPSFVQAVDTTPQSLQTNVKHKDMMRRFYKYKSQGDTDILKHKENAAVVRNLHLYIQHKLSKFHVYKSFKKRRHQNVDNIFLRRAKRSPYRLIADHVQKSDSQKFIVKNMNKMPSLVEKSASPVKTVTNLIVKMIKGENSTGSNGTWTETYKGLLSLKKHMDEKEKTKGAKIYEMRMYDLVLGHEEPTQTLGEKAKSPTFIEDAFHLVNSLTGKKGKNTKTNYKFLSPRFAPVMPDKYGNNGALSPSILSFYNDDAEEQIMPLPKLLDATGMKDKDRESVLEMIMELSGARDTVDEAMKVLTNSNLFGMEGEIVEVTNRLTKVFDDLYSTFKGYQKKEVDKRGFTFMEPHQMDKLFEQQGIKDRKDHGFDMDEYKQLSRKQKEEALWLRVRSIASNTTEFTPDFGGASLNGSSSNGTLHRSKRQIVVPNLLSVLSPTVLAPYMFTPVFGLTVLGPVVLSPSLFSPLILNPAVLSPYVLSPAVGMPFILSPYLLSPYVLSPLIMAPFILNPYVLSPNVINPYVLSPLILSPVVLGPDVLSPMVLGGGILSPTVLSPSIMSPSALMASVLSPSFLS